MHICDRLLRRDKGNLRVWKMYISYLAEQKSHKKLQLVLARAIRIHPENPDFWIVAAYAMMENENDSQGGRALLQQGLKRNIRSVDYWGEYLRYEIEAARLILEREKILFGKKKNQEKELEIIEEVISLHQNEEEAKLNESVIKTVIEAGVQQSRESNIFTLPSHFLEVLNSADFSALNLEAIKEHLFTLVQKGSCLQSHYLLLLIKDLEQAPSKKLKSFQAQVLSLLNWKNVIDSGVMLSFLMTLPELLDSKKIWKILFSKEYLPTLVKLCQNDMEVLENCIHKQTLFKETTLYQKITGVSGQSVETVIKVSNASAKSLSTNERIKALEDYLDRNKLMSSSAQSSLLIRIQLLKIIGTQMSSDALIRCFVTVAELFLGSESKFRRLEEETTNLISESVTEQAIQELLKFYTRQKLKPSFAMMNVVGVYAQSEKAQKLLEKLQN